jgi:hypothetical protein
MENGAFGKFAQLYWDRGLPVTPIKPQTKEPALSGWTGLLAAVPNEERQRELLGKYSGFGIGVLTGKEVLLKHALIALDVDDDRLNRLLLAVLELFKNNRRAVIPGKRGKKGATYFVLVDVEGRYKFKTLVGAGGLGNVDVLGPGRQTVMEGSIHPDTGLPYVTEGVSLLDTSFDSMVVIETRVIDLIGAAIGSEHAIGLMSGEATHDPGVALTAKLVAHGATDEEVTAIVKGLLPEHYNGNTLDELPGWIASARAKGFDLGGPPKPNIVAQLIGLGAGDDVELCHDGKDAAYATVPTEGGSVTLRIKGPAYKRWLRNRAYHQLQRHPTTMQVREAIETIESMALHEGQKTAVFNRVAGSHTFIEIDLGTRDGRVARITPAGWEISATTSLKFVRGAGFGVLPDPVRGGHITMLQRILGLDDETFYLIVAFLISCLHPTGPYFVLLVEGAQGSGKSFVCRTVKMVVDPNEAAKIRLPDNERDLMVQAKEFRLINFDNASAVRADISDALCALSTGGGIATRQLYTDDGLSVLSYARPFIINGISGYAKRPDLMERAIPIKLPAMPAGARRTESELNAAFDAALPQILGALYDVISAALRNYDAVTAPLELRMADAGKWVRAGEEALGVESGTIVNAIIRAQTDLVVERINDEPLFIRLRGMTAGKPFDGYVGELFAALAEDRDPTLPKTPSALSQLLDRLSPAMATAGLKVEFFPKDRGGRRVRITNDPALTGKSVRFNP